MCDYYNYINAINSCRAYNIQLKTPEYIEYENKENITIIFFIKEVQETVDNIHRTFNYYQKCIFHNIRGPAIIIYHDGRNKLSEYYFIRGKNHNRRGPASIWYIDGEIYRTHYYIDGVHLVDEKHWKEAITL